MNTLPRVIISHIIVLVSLWQWHGLLPVDAFGTTSSTTSSTATEPLFKWLIVGGGPHGVHIATRLLEEVPSIGRSDLCIVDEEPELLRKWKTRTAATGMEYLRSSASYHLDVREDDLRRYAERRRPTNSGGRSSKGNKRRKTTTTTTLFAADYSRPRLDLFNEHCDHVVRKNELDRTHVQGCVKDVVPRDEFVEVEIERRPEEEGGNNVTTTAYAENVILALGNDEPAYPDWANDELIRAGKITHVFDEDGDANCHHHDGHQRQQSIAIVGGGISAAHLALKLKRESTATTVHMICRHELREQQFDTHQDWMMDSAAAKRSEAGGGRGLPKRQRQFASEHSFAERRNIIRRERVAGTVSASVVRGKDGLRYAIAEGDRVRWHEDVVRSVTTTTKTTEDDDDDDDGGATPGRLSLSLARSGSDVLSVDRIILATGFGTRPPARSLVERIASRNSDDRLELCDCGYPAPDESLRWGGHERIFLAGALAELELGPSARNIAGARLASERIVAAALRSGDGR